jgi:hypothetical protein
MTAATFPAIYSAKPMPRYTMPKLPDATAPKCSRFPIFRFIRYPLRRAA